MENALLTQALKEVSNIRSGEVFLVKDLFKGYEWNRLKLEERRFLGRLFFNAMNQQNNYGIVAIQKTASHQQRYKKN